MMIIVLQKLLPRDDLSNRLNLSWEGSRTSETRLAARVLFQSSALSSAGVAVTSEIGEVAEPDGVSLAGEGVIPPVSRKGNSVGSWEVDPPTGVPGIFGKKLW